MSTTETTTDTTATATAAMIRKLEDDAKHGRLSIRDFRCVKKLGHGGGGVVFLVEHIESGLEIALKCIASDFGEAEIHQQVTIGGGHENVLRMYGSFRDERLYGDGVCMMLEYCPQGTVLDVIVKADSDGVWDDDNNNNNSSTEPKAESQLGKSKEAFLAKVAVDILQAVKHMEGQDFLHSDIKPANILWKDGTAKLADLGVATKLASSSSSSSSSNHACRSKKLLGTIPYMSPEALTLVTKLKLHKTSQQHGSFGYSHKAEYTWSLGVTIFVLAFGIRLPFPYEPDASKTVTENMLKYMEDNNHLSSRRIKFPTNDRDAPSDDLKNFILGLLQTNPDKRLSIEEALQHPWILHHTATTRTQEQHDRPPPLATTMTATTNHHDQLAVAVEDDQENAAAAVVQDGKTSTSTKKKGGNNDHEHAKNDEDDSKLEHALRGLDLNSP